MSSCVFSSDRVYRYVLVRDWVKYPKKTVNFIMLNPSTADEVQNDPTVERCCRRSKQWGFGRVVITNVFALRSTDPALLKKVDDPVGKRNDYWLKECAKNSDLIVCAWGLHGRIGDRQSQVMEVLKGYEVHALKLSKDGVPCHPLYLSYDLKPFVWRI